MSRNSGNGAGLEYGEMGDRLREARQARGLSLRGLAERLGVSPSLISQVETGRAKPSVSTLYAIVTELGISLDELVYADARRPSKAPPPTAPPEELSSATMPAGPVQRSSGRKSIRLASGVVWERLTTASLPKPQKQTGAHVRPAPRHRSAVRRKSFRSTTAYIDRRIA